MIESLYRCFAAAFAVVCISLVSLPAIGLGLHWAGYSDLSTTVLMVFMATAFNGASPFGLAFVVLAVLAFGYVAIYRP